MPPAVTAVAMDRAGAGRVLGGLGLLAVFVSFLLGGVPPGFGFGSAAFLLRAGIAFTLLGVATVSRGSRSVEEAVVVSIVTVVTVFVVGTLGTFYDVVTTTPAIEPRLPVTAVVVTQAAFAIGSAPIPAGYVAGVLEARGRPSTAFRAFVGTTIVAWVVPGSLMLARGFVGDFAPGLVLVHAIAAAGCALVPRQLVRGVTSRAIRR